MFIDKLKIDEIDRIEDRATKIHAAAVAYAEAGLYVMPLRVGGKAIPETKYGINYAHASKNKKVIEKWFGPGGQFEGWNIGIACGRKNGVFVVDIDCKNGVNGFDSLAHLTEGEEIDAPCQITPSGGRHYVFKWMPNGVSSSSKLGSGIDTRGGSEDQCKSHIVAWPSVTSVGEYRWERGGDIADAPEWVADGLGVPWGGAMGRGNENVSADDVERQYTPTQIWDILQHINPDQLSYEEWVSVGQAINTQCPGEEGLKLWDTWSRAGTRYEVNECQKRWRGFVPTGPIRMGTLVWMAKQGGYQPDAGSQSSPEERHDDIIAELNKTYGVVMVGGKVRILAEIRDGNPFSPGHQLMTKEDFSLFLSNKFVIMADAKGNPKRVPISMLWLASEERRSFINGITFDPSKPREFDGYFNLWEGFALEPEPGSWKKIDWYLKNILCSGNEEHYEWLLDWIADMLQDPANPKGTAVVMKGEEGAGKGTLAKLLGRMLGTHYKHVVHERHLVGNFNAHLANAVLVFADEVLYGGQKKIAGALKSLVTENQLTVERKGVDADSYRNCVHLILASNEDWFIPAGPQSRRWFVLDVSSTKAKNKEFFSSLYEEINGDGAAAFMHDMMNRKIKSNLNCAPETKLLLEQRSMASSADPIINWWSERIDSGILGIPSAGEAQINGEESDWPELVDRFVAYETFMAWCTIRNVRYNQGSGHFYAKMMAFGCSETRPSINRARIKCLKIPPLGDAARRLKAVAGVNLTRD